MDAIVGEIRHFAVQDTPDGWLPCRGQVLNIDDYRTLFHTIGHTYGGDGTTSFALPDMNGLGGARQAVGSNACICHSTC